MIDRQLPFVQQAQQQPYLAPASEIPSKLDSSAGGRDPSQESPNTSHVTTHATSNLPSNSPTALSADQAKETLILVLERWAAELRDEKNRDGLRHMRLNARYLISVLTYFCSLAAEQSARALRWLFINCHRPRSS